MKNKKNRKLKFLSKKILMGLLLGTAILVPMMPSAYALPSEGPYASSNASSIVTTGNIMDITGTTTNNVVNWNSFSIANGETVKFTDDNNYLNLVKGASQSTIDGILSGGSGDIYLVNPNGIIFGSNAMVNVGHLIASTRAITDVNTTEFVKGNSPITNSVESVVGNITNLGKIQANNVVLEGNEVIIKNVKNVTIYSKEAKPTKEIITDVTIKAADDITVGHEVTDNDLNEINIIPADYGHTDIGTGSKEGIIDILGSRYTGTALDGTTKEITEAFLVEDVYDLQNMKANLSANYLLANDIEESYTFTPVGTNVEHFTGTFNGADNVISGLTIGTTDDSYVGLFGYVESATIKNVGVNNTVIGNDSVGGLVGYASNRTTIRNSYNEGSVSGNNNVGGLVGRSSASDWGWDNSTNITISDSYNKGTVSGNEVVGGIVGRVCGITITNSYNTGDIIGDFGADDEEDWWGGGTGGLVGRGRSTITNSYNTGKVSGDLSVGGLVGHGRSTITSSYNTGDIIGDFGLDNEEDWWGAGTGGLVGNGSSTITNSYNTGNVSGDSSTGGLVGRGRSTITNSYNTGDIIGDFGVDDEEDWWGGGTGGLVGHGRSTITNSYNTGNVSGDSSIGGLVGYGCEIEIIDSYYATTDSDGNEINKNSNSYDGAYAKTYAEMLDVDTYAFKDDIDIIGGEDKTWRIYEGYTTPMLKSIIINEDCVLPTVGDNDNSEITIEKVNSLTMNVVGSADNNVVKWDTFSIEKNASVNFKDAKNYLNIVTGTELSDIEGTIYGDGDIYLVNPNGVIFGDDAWVNVGSLTISTRSLDEVLDANILAFKTSGTNPIINNLTDLSSVEDITYDGRANVGSLTLEGNEVIIKNVDNVTSYDGKSLLTGENVKIKASDDITVGHKVDDQVELDETTDITLNAADYGHKEIGTGSEEGITYISSSGYTGTNLDGSTSKDITEAFLVEDIYDLQNMNANLSANYLLANDIDASETSDITKWSDTFTPVGSSDEGANFTGSFNGAGDFIEGLTINKVSQDRVGLFGYVDGASIKNIGIENSNIQGSNYVGGLVGDAESATISNSYNNGSITGGSRVGGLVGYAPNTTISNSYNNGSIIGDSRVGGLVGDAHYTTISNSYNKGSISGDIKDDSSVGGLVGDTYNTIISNSYNTGDLNFILDLLNDDSEYLSINVGGLVGRSHNPEVDSISNNLSIISNSYNTGNLNIKLNPIEGDSERLNINVGGLVGEIDNSIDNLSIISNSYNTGDIEFSLDCIKSNSERLNIKVGGLVGELKSGEVDNLEIISNAYNTGNLNIELNSIKSDSEDLKDLKDLEYLNISAGGLVGELYDDILVAISSSYNMGNISISSANDITTIKYSSSCIGGLIGSINDSLMIKNSYNVGDISVSLGSIKSYAEESNIVAGGLVGYASDIEINSSYNLGAISGDASIGGLVGPSKKTTPTISDSYYATTDSDGKEINKNSNSYGVAKTYAEMLDVDTYAFKADIDTTGEEVKTWRMYEGYTTPMLKTFMETVQVNVSENTYNGEEQTGTVSTLDGITLNSNIWGNMGTNTGIYTIYSDQQGYNLVSSVGGVTPVYTINPKELTVNMNDFETIYGGKDARYTSASGDGVDTSNADYNVVGYVNGEASDSNVTDNVTVDVTNGAYVNGTDGKTNDVANYKVTGFASIADGNYVLTSATATEAVAKVTKADLILTANTETVTYGDKTPKFKGVEAGLVNGDLAKSNVSYALTDRAAKDVGSYEVNGIVSEAFSKNYNVVQADENVSAYTINPKELTISMANATMTYGSLDITWDNSLGDNEPLKLTGFISGEGYNNINVDEGDSGYISIELDSEGILGGLKTNNVGTYDIYADSITENLKNYTITNKSFNDAGINKLSIIPKKITVNMNDATMTYGNDTENWADNSNSEDGTFTSTKYNVSGFAYDEATESSITNGVRVVTTNNALDTNDGDSILTKNAGNYDIEGLVSLNGLGNYTLTSTEANKGIATVNRAILTLIADEVNVYTVDDTKTKFTGNISGFVNGDGVVEPTFALELTTGENAKEVGEYAVYGKVEDYADNYTVIQADGNITAYKVTKAAGVVIPDVTDETVQEVLDGEDKDYHETMDAIEDSNPPAVFLAGAKLETTQNNQPGITNNGGATGIGTATYDQKTDSMLITN